MLIGYVRLEAEGLAFRKQRAKTGVLNYGLDRVERAMGLEPTALCLGSRCSTTELRPLGFMSGYSL